MDMVDRTTKKKVTRWISLTVIIVIVILTTIWGICRYRYETPKINFVTVYSDTLAVIPIYSYYGSPHTTYDLGEGYSTSFLIDTGDGSACFEIRSEKDWSLIEKAGWFSDDNHWYAPLLKVDGHGEYDLHQLSLFQSYEVGSVPVITGRVRFDEKTRSCDITHLMAHSQQVGDIKGVHFYKAFTSTMSELHRTNIIGMSFLNNQIVEFSKKKGEMRFHRFVPTDYTQSIDIRNDRQKMIHGWKRFQMPVEIHGQTKWFFIDTGIGSHRSLRLPMKESTGIAHNLQEETITSYSGQSSKEVYYLIDSLAHFSIGGRDFQHDVFYTDDARTPYGINPFDIFEEDFILDFKNEKLWLKKQP